MPPEFLTPEEVRAMIERTEARNAELRAKYPHSAHILIMERALLGELRRKPLLPPLDNDPRSPDDAHQ